MYGIYERLPQGKVQRIDTILFEQRAKERVEFLSATFLGREFFYKARDLVVSYLSDHELNELLTNVKREVAKRAAKGNRNGN